MKFIPFLLGCSVGASLFISCGQQEVTETEKTTETADTNWQPDMYQASELVLLMRQINDDLSLVKTQVEKGEIPAAMPESYMNLHTAKPTETQHLDTVYHAMADKWMADYKAMTEADAASVKAKYNTLIETCVACHSNYCMGPIPKIKKLVIK